MKIQPMRFTGRAVLLDPKGGLVSKPVPGGDEGEVEFVLPYKWRSLRGALEKHQKQIENELGPDTVIYVQPGTTWLEKPHLADSGWVSFERPQGDQSEACAPLYRREMGRKHFTERRILPRPGEGFWAWMMGGEESPQHFVKRLIRHARQRELENSYRQL